MQDPIGPLKVVATNEMFFDPAIDMTDYDAPPEGAEAPAGAPALTASERLETYRRTRDVAALRFKPDATPTFFVCKPLKATDMVALESNSAGWRRMTVFACAVHEITLEGGAVLKPRKLTKLNPADPRRGDAADDDWINDCAERFGLETIYEVADVVTDRARLPRNRVGGFLFRVGPGPAL